MIRCRLFSMISALLVLACATAEATVLDDLEGKWHGILSDEAGQKVSDLPDASISIEKSGSGFEASWTGADGKIRTHAFRKVEGRDYYAGSEDGGIMSMFGKGDEPDPLDGDPLMWARLTDDMLIIYTLEITASGEYQLLRNNYSKIDNGFRLDASIWVHGDKGLTVSGNLERSGD